VLLMSRSRQLRMYCKSQSLTNSATVRGLMPPQ
jgi:hypothetical protein